jgi:transmembrane sensor
LAPVFRVMEQKDFQRILDRYLQGQASVEEKRIIDSWYDVMGKDHHSLLNSQEKLKLEKSVRLTVVAHIQSTKRTDPGSLRLNNSRVMTWYSIGIAATILLMIVSSIYIINSNESLQDKLASTPGPAALTWTQLANTHEVAKRVNLPDGSHVTLEPQSRIKFSSAFNESKREVHLEGEALFEVYHNERSPFYVFANEVTTMVLGTSFRVKAFEHDKNITVAVRTGKVSVYTNRQDKKESTKANEIVLTPNQQIIYDRNEKTILRRIVELPLPILSEEKVKRMRFEEAPVKEVFEALEKVYGVDIVFEEQRFSSCRLTTSISDGGIYNRLNNICKAIGATYILNENQIMIQGSGCN